MKYVLSCNHYFLKTCVLREGIPNVDITEDANRAKTFPSRAKAEAFMDRMYLVGSYRVVTLSEVAAK